jgi:uncharacterized protein (DUF302 family)
MSDGSAEFFSSVRANQQQLRSNLEPHYDNAKIEPSSFTRFLTLDHDDWLSVLGQPRKARQYLIGNPLVAITMLHREIRVGLNVPVRVWVYRDEASGAIRFEYDQPSTLMSGLENRDVTAAAEKLDAKLAAPANSSSATAPN